ncbi:MAG: hypothetical protein AAGI91_15010 [Bacteroidota bacterium]
MSEYKVDALYVSPSTIASVEGSGNAALVETLRGCADGLPEPLEGAVQRSVGRRAIAEAAVRIVQGEAPLDASAPAFSFARWLVAHAVSAGTPDPPWIGYPFVDLYAVNEVFRQRPYSRLTQFLEELGGEQADRLPLGEGTSFPLPGVGYADPERLAAMAGEARAARRALEAEEDWTFDLDDDPEDLVQVFQWIEDAAGGEVALALFLTGDL